MLLDEDEEINIPSGTGLSFSLDLTMSDCRVVDFLKLREKNQHTYDVHLTTYTTNFRCVFCVTLEYVVTLNYFHFNVIIEAKLVWLYQNSSSK